MLTSEERLNIEQLTMSLLKALYTKEAQDHFVEFATMREHRTNQQLFMSRVIVPVMKAHAAKPAGYYDLRNEATVMWCKSIEEHLQEAIFPFI